jgi:hypothetical protein
MCQYQCEYTILELHLRSICISMSWCLRNVRSSVAHLMHQRPETMQNSQTIIKTLTDEPGLRRQRFISMLQHFGRLVSLGAICSLERLYSDGEQAEFAIGHTLTHHTKSYDSCRFLIHLNFSHFVLHPPIHLSCSARLISELVHLPTSHTFSTSPFIWNSQDAICESLLAFGT